MLQNIKCHASADMLTLNWMEARDVPWVDFSIKKQCRDFNVLVDYQDKYALSKAKFDARPKPPPEKVHYWPAPWIHHETELGHKLAAKVDKGLPNATMQAWKVNFQEEAHQH
jgi:hypothetical protein